LTEIGIQFHLPTHASKTVPELQELTRRCADGGVEQVWITDNLGSRSLFVVLGAFAATPINKVGAAVMVQYFRSPIEAARGLASISELMDGRELSVGLGSGNPTTSGSIKTPRAIAFMRETAECLRTLLSGVPANAADYPLISDYFNVQSDSSMAIRFKAPGPVRLYGGGNGPLGLKVARSSMDGVIFGGTMLLPTLKLGRLGDVLGDRINDRGVVSRRVAGVKISVHEDSKTARDFVKPSVGGRMGALRESGFTDADFEALGVDPDQVDALLAARKSGKPRGELGALVNDAMIDSMFIAGDPDECRAGLAAVQPSFDELGFDQLMFSELGPEPDDAVSLLLNRVIHRV
jgi:alkanesulfonate monooxygenase SsuD/methylene tetrahydromethanopterin reductase-like flavin-dependent oxidoreductase (luciferase family)